MIIYLIFLFTMTNCVKWNHGSHIVWLTNFPIFVLFFNTAKLKFTEKKIKVVLKFKSLKKFKMPKIHWFSSILCAISWLFQSAENSPTFPWLESALLFSRFSRLLSQCGNHEYVIMWNGFNGSKDGVPHPPSPPALDQKRKRHKLISVTTEK